MGQLGTVEETGRRAATTQRSRVGPGPAKVGLRATATLLQKGDIVGRYTVQNLSAGGALLTGAKDVIKASPCRLLLQLPSGESLTVGAHVRRRAVAGDVVALSGDLGACVAELTVTDELAAELSLFGLSAMARRRLGALDANAEARGDADRYFQAQRVHDPERITRVYLPGFDRT